MLDVLIACEESQVVCSAFRLLGHNAFSCDLVPCSGSHPEWHIQSDCLPLLDGFCCFYTLDGVYHYLDKRWDLLICHPPCTYLTKCGARFMFPNGVLDLDRFSKAMLAKDFFLRCLSSDCNYIALENPTPLKIVGLPNPSDVIQPYYFGDPYSKRTCLWLKNLPPLFRTLECSSHLPWIKSSHPLHNGFAHSVKLRSRTFSGVAAAMASQWSSFILSEYS